ncbi:hypothetical protein [Umezawaea sp. Da 62-37]|uniref:hypothetical protein n=1 Tax=Umezawaea sp. Da 62-37 TaxID=3075927 RepID=UPI0028F70404|nr:hypothetical protein [Umezawaea sp. Da 62-37]WNV82977.1 hypothetical protein RM788_32935 [Umezawaea sp. Da 62-37]
MTGVASERMVDATPVVPVVDGIDIHIAFGLEAVLVAAFAAVRAQSPVVIDLAAVEFFSCAELGLLVRFHYSGLAHCTPLRVVVATHSVLWPI